MDPLSLPDIAGMLILIGVLAWLRGKHRDAQVDLWLLGLSFILLQAIAVSVYRGSELFHRGMQVLALDSYVLAAITFGWAARGDLLPRRRHLPLFLMPAVPLLLETTAYGLEVTERLPYLVVSLLSLAVGVLYLIYVFHGSLRLRLTLLAAHGTLWLPMTALVLDGRPGEAVYWGLACLYLLVAVSFRGRVQRNRIGGVVIVAGFVSLALCFLLHPFLEGKRFFDGVLEQVWNLQKFLVILGMLVTLLEDETARREAEAMHDPLTGLPNRRLFEDRFRQALARARRSRLSLAVFLIDLNGFKEINDTFGHAAGDRALQAAAERLQAHVRSSDTLARCGGDEFCIIISEIGMPEDARRIAEMLRNAVSTPELTPGSPEALSGSIGFALYPEDAIDIDPLMHLADARMYADKRGLRELATA